MPNTKAKPYDKTRLDAMHSPLTKDEFDSVKSWGEAKYLKDRGKLTARQEAAAGFRPRRGVGGTFPPGEEPDDEGDVYEEYNALAFARAAQEPSDEDYIPGDDAEAAEDYEEWTKEEMEAELVERNQGRDSDDQLSTGGVVSQMRKRLIKDDAALAEAEAEQD